MESYAYTPEGKSQSKRMVESRLALGCTSAKDFYNKYGKGKLDGKDLFSYPQYQKYESGERLLGQKAAILFAQIFNVNWEWLKFGEIVEDFSNISEEEKNILREWRKNQAQNKILPNKTKAV